MTSSPGRAVGRLLRDQRLARESRDRRRCRAPSHSQPLPRGDRAGSLRPAAGGCLYSRVPARLCQPSRPRCRQGADGVSAVGPVPIARPVDPAGRFPAGREARADRARRADGAAGGRRRLRGVALPAAPADDREPEGAAGAGSSAGDSAPGCRAADRPTAARRRSRSRKCARRHRVPRLPASARARRVGSACCRRRVAAPRNRTVAGAEAGARRWSGAAARRRRRRRLRRRRRRDADAGASARPRPRRLRHRGAAPPAPVAQQEAVARPLANRQRPPRPRHRRCSPTRRSIARTNSWIELRGPAGDVLAQTYVRAGESYTVPAGIAYRIIDAR